jgi:excinuclease UvrABC nuclease subunit
VTTDQATEFAPLNEALVGQPYVYYLYDAAERLLYVGSTRHLRRRLGEHRRKQPWYPKVTELRAFPFPTLDAALAAESKAIRDCLPRYNRQGKPETVFDLGSIFNAFFGGDR